MSLKFVLKAIRKHKTFLITTHVNPDIDGLASELTLALFLKTLGKKVHVVNVEKVLPMHAFLPSVRLVKGFSHQNIDYDAAIVVDCGDLDRIAKVRKLIKKDKPLINIDHHITNDFFGRINLVNIKASSTAEVIFDLLKEAKCRLTKNMAILLYLGIMTDTGSFRFDNTTSGTHRIVSGLMKFKFSVAQLYKRVYETVPLKDLRIFTKLIGHFQMTHRGRVASIELPNAAIDKFSEEFDLREKIFSLLRAIKGVEVIAIFTEHEHNATRLNFRSQGKADVAKLASFFKGGGHQRASGCWVKGDIKEAKRKVFLQLTKVLK